MSYHTRDELEPKVITHHEPANEPGYKSAYKSASEPARGRFPRRKLARTAVAGLATLASTAFLSSATAFAATSDVHSNALVVNHQTWRSVPYVTSGGTTYFGIWYLQQLLSQYGIQNHWDGHSLQLDALPSANVSSQTTINGTALANTPTYTYGGVTYVNVSSILTAVGGASQYISSSKTVSITLPPTPSTSDQTTPASSPGRANAVTTRQPISSSDFPAVRQAKTTSPAASRQAKTTTASTASVALGGANVYENGQLWRHVPIVYRNGTTFFGVWYLQQWLSQHGIQNQWDGKKLSIGALPAIHPNTTIQSSVGSVQTTAFALGNDWFVPVETLQNLGLSATVSGSAVTSGGAGGTTVASGGSGATLSGMGQNVDVQYTGAPAQASTTIQGHLSFQGTPFSVHEVSIRNQVTHAHYYATVSADGSFSMTVPSGGYEVYALVGDGDPVFLVNPFVTTGTSFPLTVTVPALPTGNQLPTAHATIVAADSAITPEQMLSVSQMFEHVYAGDVTATGITPGGKVTISLYSSASTYQQHFQDEGYSATEAQEIATNAVATDEGTNTISVLMPALNEVDGMNILAHEFTHALIANVSTQIPSWANEGVAWIEGIRGEADGSPDAVLQQGLQWAQWMDIVAHQQEGDLLPLGGANPLDGNYNVESQDYYAVQQLVNQFGLAKFMTYIRSIDVDQNAFQDTFGESFPSFSNQVTSALRAQAHSTDNGFTAQIRILSGGPQQIYVIDPDGNRQIISGLQAGQVYTIQCNNDGTIQVPSGLQVSTASTMATVQDGDWFIGSGGGDGSGSPGTGTSGASDRQEFDIGHQFAVPFLELALLYDDQGNVIHAYPATQVPNGIQIVALKGES